RVHGPTEVSSTTRSQEARQHQNDTNSGQREAESVQTRESHVRSTNLKRQNVVSKTPNNRGTEQKQHHRAVHGEHLVELLVRKELKSWGEELSTDKQSHQTADKEER